MVLRSLLGALRFRVAIETGCRPAAPRETEPEEPVLKLEKNPSSFAPSSMVWIGAEYTPSLPFFVARRQTDGMFQNGVWQQNHS